MASTTFGPFGANLGIEAKFGPVSSRKSSPSEAVQLRGGGSTAYAPEGLPRNASCIIPFKSVQVSSCGFFEESMSRRSSYPNSDRRSSKHRSHRETISPQTTQAYQHATMCFVSSCLGLQQHSEARQPILQPIAHLSVADIQQREDPNTHSGAPSPSMSSKCLENASRNECLLAPHRSHLRRSQLRL